MSSTYRVRRLQAYGEGITDYDELPSAQRRGLVVGTANYVLSEAAAVRHIKAEDAELTGDEVLARLKSGALRKRDLVFVDGRWMSIGDVEAFEDAETKAEPIASTGTWVILLLLAAAGGMALFMWQLLPR